MTARQTVTEVWQGKLRFAPIGLGDAQERLFEHFRNLPLTQVVVGNTIITFGGQEAGKELWKRSSAEIAVRKLGHTEAEVANFICPDCGNKTINICHIVPKSFGGVRNIENLEMDCEKCNKDESNKVWLADVDLWARKYELELTITYEVK